MGNSWGLKVTLSLPIPFLFDTTDLFTNFLSVWYFREAGFKHIYPFKFLIILCIVYFILIIICILQYFISFCNSKPFLYIKKKNSWVLLLLVSQRSLFLFAMVFIIFLLSRPVKFYMTVKSPNEHIQRGSTELLFWKM